MGHAPTQISPDLSCHACGYDLRAHPADGACPECGATVAESRRLAAIPRRPTWQNTDPRWRRRMLAGAWLLVLLPLMEALKALGWASLVPVPTVFDRQGPRTLEESLIALPYIYPPLIFCTGVALLFSKERGRRAGRLDWTRRWGVLLTYVVFLLSAVPALFIVALVLVGIAALCLSISPRFQPEATGFFVSASSTYLLYGPHPSDASDLVLVASSSITVILACVPLLNALRSSGPKWVAAVLLTPLILFALWHLSQAGRCYLGFEGVSLGNVSRYQAYFRPQLLIRRLAGVPGDWWIGESTSGDLYVEAAKWCIVIAVAVWLTIAQLALLRRRKRTSAT